MKKFLLLLMVGFTLLNVKSVFAHENILRTNVLGDVVGFRGLEYERAISDRKAISVDYWVASGKESFSDTSSSLSNLRFLFREYEKADQLGLFYAVGVSYLNASYSSPSLLGKDNHAIGLDFKLGSQGRIGENLVVSSTIGFIYFVSPVKKTVVADSVSESLNISGFLPNIGVNFGYSF